MDNMSTERAKIIETLQEIFIEITKDSSIVLYEDTVLIGSIGEHLLRVSSLEFVQIVVEAEDRFNVIIDFDVPINSVSDFVNVIISGQNIENSGELKRDEKTL